MEDTSSVSRPTKSIPRRPFPEDGSAIQQAEKSFWQILGAPWPHAARELYGAVSDGQLLLGPAMRSLSRGREGASAALCFVQNNAGKLSFDSGAEVQNRVYSKTTAPQLVRGTELAIQRISNFYNK